MCLLGFGGDPCIRDPPSPLQQAACGSLGFRAQGGRPAAAAYRQSPAEKG